MNKLRILFTVVFTLVVTTMAVFAYGGLELVEPATGVEAVGAPDIETRRYRVYQAFKAEAANEPETVDIEVVRHQAYQAFKTEAANEPETVDIEVVRHQAYQAFKAEAANEPETVDIEVVRHQAYQAFKADAAAKVVADGGP